MSVSAESEEVPVATGRLVRFLLYGASRTVVEGIIGVRGLVLAVVLGPEAFGVWALFRLICRYGSLANLGIATGVEFEVVRARTGDSADGAAEGRRWGRAAATYIWGVFGTLSVALFVASFWVSEPNTALTLRGLSCGLILDRFWNYSKAYLRVVSTLRRFAITELWHAVFQLTLSCAGAWLWGLPGALGGFVVACLAVLLLVVRGVPFRPILSPRHLRRLIAVGLPVMSLAILVLGLTTVDRFVIAAIGGTALLGTYSFAVAVAGLGTSLAWSIRTVVVPEVYSESGESGGADSRRHVEGTLKPFALLYPMLLGFVAILIGPVVYYLAPQYRAAIPVAQLFVFTGVTVGLHGLGALTVVAAGRERAVPAVAAATFLANGVFALIAVSSGWGLWTVAAGALGARALLAGGIVRLATGTTTISNPWAATLRMMLPLVWCVVAVSLIVRLVGGSEPPQVLLALFCYLLAITPWIPAAVREIRRARVVHA